MNSKTRFSIVGCITLIGIFLACTNLDAQESSEPRIVHSKTQQGVTVRLEKVTVERIFNAPAWIKAEENRTKAGKEAADELRQHLPARLVTYFVSVVGESKSLGVTKIDFVDGKKTVASVNRFFSPPKWQPRLPKLAVDSTASGIETQHLLNGKTQLSDIFPAKLEVQVTTAKGKELTFLFENVEF